MYVIINTVKCSVLTLLTNGFNLKNNFVIVTLIIFSFSSLSPSYPLQSSTHTQRQIFIRTLHAYLPASLAILQLKYKCLTKFSLPLQLFWTKSQTLTNQKLHQPYINRKILIQEKQYILKLSFSYIPQVCICLFWNNHEDLGVKKGRPRIYSSNLVLKSSLVMGSPSSVSGFFTTYST